MLTVSSYYLGEGLSSFNPKTQFKSCRLFFFFTLILTFFSTSLISANSSSNVWSTDVENVNPLPQYIAVGGGPLVETHTVTVAEGEHILLDFRLEGIFTGFEVDLSDWTFIYTRPDGAQYPGGTNGVANDQIAFDASGVNVGIWQVDYTDPQGVTNWANFTINVAPPVQTLAQYIAVGNGPFVQTHTVSVDEDEQILLDFGGEFPGWTFIYTRPDGAQFPGGTNGVANDQITFHAAGVNVGVWQVDYTNPQGVTNWVNFTVNVNPPAPVLTQYIAVGDGPYIQTHTVNVEEDEQIILDFGGEYPAGWSFTYTRPDGVQFPGGTNGVEIDQITFHAAGVNVGVWQVDYTNPEGVTNWANFTVNVVPVLTQYIAVGNAPFSQTNTVNVAEDQQILLDFGGEFPGWTFIYTRPDGVQFPGGTNGVANDQITFHAAGVNVGVWQVDYTNPEGATNWTNFTVNVNPPAPVLTQYIAVGNAPFSQTNTVNVAEGQQILLDFGGEFPGWTFTYTRPDGAQFPGGTNGVANDQITFDASGVNVGVWQVDYTNPEGLINWVNFTVNVNPPAPILTQYIAVGNGPFVQTHTVTVCEDQQILLDFGGEFPDWSFTYTRPDGVQFPGGTNGVANDQITFHAAGVNLGVWQVDYTNPEGLINWVNFTVNATPASEPGSTCDDGDDSTENDVIVADGCSCQGTPIVLCDNVTNGGTIEGTQTICPNESAATITSASLPSGGSGDLEYLWLSSTVECPTSVDQAIPGADQATYNPGELTQTTYFVRCSRRSGCTSWNFGESNCIRVTVSNDDCGNNDSEDLCDNITVEANDTGIVIGGLNSAAVSSVQVFNSSWQTEFSCFGDCAATTIVPVTAGTYIVYAKLYTSSYSLICEIKETIVVTAGGGGGTICDNVTSGGTIGGTQTICPNESAATLTSVSLPSGGSGNVEYLWLSSTTGCPTSLNQEISGANQATYNPGVLTQTTYFVRCSRRSGCTSWEVGESNCVTVTVSDAGCGNNDSEDLCDNITIEANDTGIVVGGLNSAAVSSVQVFDASWQTEFSCFGDCAATTTVPVTAGTYLVYVKLYTSGYSLICEINETVVVTAGGGGGTTCDNVTSGGTIGGTQTICPNESAATLTSVSLPSGGSGNVEYLWLSSTTGCPTSLNQEISGANQATYNPGVLTQTTYFVRCSRRSGCTSWEVGESNCVTVTVSDAGCGGGTTCDNVTSGGAISGTQTICPNETATTLTSASLPSGGSGNVEYLWLSSTTGCPTSLNQEISGANQATYNPGVLTQTTYFVRCSRRSGCTSWEFGESNCVTVTVSDADCGGGTGNSNGIDLTVTISGDDAEVSPYTDFSVDLTVTNEGTQNATNVVVNIPQPENVVFQGGNGFSATQGDYDLFSTFNWNLGSIAAGQTATITLNYYALAGAPYTVYGQVQSMTGTDVDSTPGNGTPPNPNEDDEAVYVTGSGGTTGTGGGTGGTPTCTLNLAAAVSNIVCNDNGTPANAADDTFTFDVLVTGGNPWGWTGGGQSGDYAQVASYGPYDISAGNINFTIVDNDNATCTTNVSVTAPSTCSNDGTNGGGTTPTNDCSDISVGESGGDIVISGLDNAPLTGVWVFDINWNTVFDCSYGCGAMETIDVNPGTYHVIVKKLNTDWSVICEINETVIISAFIFQNIGNLDSPTQVGEEDADYRNDNTSVEKTEVAFGVYPNPASNFINITLDDETTGTINLSLTDKFGRRIYQQNNNADDMRAIKLDLSNYAAGVYFLTLQSEDSLPVTKQIVLLK